MALSGIPLKMFGVLAGTARINDDGTVDTIMNSPNAFGQNLMQQFQSGVITALCIAPEYVPTESSASLLLPQSTAVDPGE